MASKNDQSFFIKNKTKEIIFKTDFDGANAHVVKQIS